MLRFKVRIYEEKSPTGRSSLILVVTGPGGYRRKESLKLYCQTIPRNLLERKDREEKLLIASQIANEREQEFLRGAYDVPEQYRTSDDFLAYAWEYVRQQEDILVETKKYEAALRKFEAFLGKTSIPAYEITPNLLERFVKYMERKHCGETPQGYLSRLKIIIRAATNDLLFRKNPAQGLRARKVGGVVKAILTMEEIRLLWKTPSSNEDVRRAFLFACATGLRFCDVNALKWSNIKSDRVEIVQQKTKTLVSIPLKEEALTLLGERKDNDEPVFRLPSHTGVSKSLKAWATKAGIQKKVTFHCARHSLGTAMIMHNVNLATASKILGHANITQTQRYVRISEDMKKQALSQLPSFNA
jgi:integrase/recombinase XerD